MMIFNSFCCGVKFAWDSLASAWKVLGATDNRFPDGVKIVGGTNKENPSEPPKDTVIREFDEEAHLLAKHYKEVWFRTIPGRNGGIPHTQHFYLITKTAGTFPFDSTHQFDDDGDQVTVRWWTLAEFEKALLPSHKVGFQKAFLEMASIDEKFKQDNLEMFTRYSEIKFE